MKLLATIIISELAIIASAAICNTVPLGGGSCNSADKPTLWRCLPTSTDRGMKYGPPNIKCNFLLGSSQEKHYCCQH
ncbi:hypothetical protein M3J09_012426 [Ascochyta lentis]